MSFTLGTHHSKTGQKNPIHLTTEENTSKIHGPEYSCQRAYEDEKVRVVHHFCSNSHLVAHKACISSLCHKQAYTAPCVAVDTLNYLVQKLGDVSIRMR